MFGDHLVISTGNYVIMQLGTNYSIPVQNNVRCFVTENRYTKKTNTYIKTMAMFFFYLSNI